MVYDRKITITTGSSRFAEAWNPQTILWSEFVDKIKSPVRSTETLAEYLASPKKTQDNLKDVGGFVGGTLKGTTRKSDRVQSRDLITLDFDNIPAGCTMQVLQILSSLGCGYAVYSTRKHEESKPRLRAVFPLDRSCTADEYEPIARKLAELIGISYCDPTTFQASRLMYWPSVSSDSVYVYTYEDKPMLSADGMLALYGDWHNIAEWPEVPNAPQARVKLAAKQGDPTEKKGIVGAFCKTYNVYDAMDRFLPGVYIPCDTNDRLSYSEGSTTGGAVIYDNGNFLYSHHATDPAGGRLCNAFDLVRLHKFGELDDEAKQGTPTNKLPSYQQMCRFAVDDSRVSALLNTERYKQATEEFSQLANDTANWISKLAVSPATGVPIKTVDNVLIILENDPLLKDKIAFDEFSEQIISVGSLPWDNREQKRCWCDSDDAGLRHYIEKVYTITGKDRIYDACVLASKKHTVNDVKDYLEGLEWDGVQRLDTIFIDYLGAADTVYTRAVSRKSFTAAVARAMHPGCKYDTMPIIGGPQGIGKSTLLRIMGRAWYSDSLTTFEGKEAAEMLRGTWLNELGELSGMNKSEMGAVKQFLSKVEDLYRAPYGRRTETHPRRCVFFGTTNDAEYLRDRTGNRRFWPIDCAVNEPKKSVFTQLSCEVDQLWAEAVMYWRLGEKLYLDGEAADIAAEEQEKHKEHSTKEGLIYEFVRHKVPKDWNRRTLSQRKLYWANEFGKGSEELVHRDKVCALEVWCECLNGEAKMMRQTDTREINSILASMPELERMVKTQRFIPDYGVQRGFRFVTVEV